jgi:hypothetical protein
VARAVRSGWGCAPAGSLSVYRMSEGVVAGPALAEPQTEARDIIAACRSAWSTVSANQPEGAEVDESALTVYARPIDLIDPLQCPLCKIPSYFALLQSLQRPFRRRCMQWPVPQSLQQLLDRPCMQ